MAEENNEKRNPDVKRAQEDANRDPLSGRAGAHPVGAGIGAATGGAIGGAATGAAIGTAAGPVGTAVGAAIGTAVGGVIGGLAGKGIAEKVDPTLEHGYWRDNYKSRPYTDSNLTYDEYGPAYQFGWERQSQSGGTNFEESEPAMKQDWQNARGKSTLGWDKAREAARDSWNRVSNRSENQRGR